MTTTADQIQQRIEWRTRLVRDILSGEHSADTVWEMLFAGIDQAYSEGILVAADICDDVAHRSNDHNTKRVCIVLSESLRKLDALNKQNADIPAGRLAS